MGRNLIADSPLEWPNFPLLIDTAHGQGNLFSHVLVAVTQWVLLEPNPSVLTKVCAVHWSQTFGDLVQILF